MKTDGETEVETAASCPSPGQAPIKTWLQSSRRRAAAASTVVADPTARFHGDGVRYKAKLIGTDEVVQAQGDKMCLDSMMKLKGQEAASRSHGKHKQRIWLRVCSKGLKIVDEKTGCVTYEHDARRISSLRRDESDPRALAYVFQHLHSYTLFYIKTANTADPVLEDIQEVCHNLDQVAPEEPTQVPADLAQQTPETGPATEVLPSNELADIFAIRLDEPATANHNAASSQPGSPEKPLSTAQGLSNVPVSPVGGSPYSSPTAMGPWGRAGPFASLSPPTSPPWGGGGVPAPWPSQTGAPAAWAPSGSMQGPAWAPPYGLPQHQQQPSRVTWGQKEGMYPGVAPTTAQLFSGPPTSGGPGTPAHPQQPFLL